jgi:FAD/FMN-containing dehydrogenase
VVRAIGTADVVAVVQFAKQHGVLLSIKGGGHNIAGLACADGGLMLDMSLMRGVWVDAGERLARAQAGCLLGDVDRECQLHGLAPVLGFVSATGIAGLTLGGGFGYLSRRFGWTSDNVRSMEMVTADGKIVRASEKENADLFWGLRGGGGNFGVLTGIEYELHPIGPEIYGGAIAWRADDAPAVLAKVAELANEGPVETSVACVMRNAPPAPWIAKDAHGQAVIVAAICHTGSIESGEKVIAPLRQIGKPVGDVCMKRPYVTQQSLLDATQPKGRRYYWKSEYVASFSPEMLAAFHSHAAKILGPHTGNVLFPLGEGIGRHGNDHSAVGNREARGVFNITAQWEKPEDDAAQVEFARAAWRDLKRFSTGGTYVNFLTEEESGDRIQAAYGRNFERLIEIKSKWDPENLFRMNKNIAPRTVKA